MKRERATGSPEGGSDASADEGARGPKRPRRDAPSDSAAAAEPAWRQLDALVAARLSAFLSDDALAFDDWLRDRMADDPRGEGWLPLAAFTATYARVKDLTADDAVVAHAVAHRSPDLVVSEDGKRVRRARPFALFADPHFADRAVYVEGLPPDAAPADLFASLFGPVERVLEPHVLSPWNEKLGPGVAGRYPDLAISKQARKRKAKRPAYCFVVFGDPSSAAACCLPGALSADPRLRHARALPFAEHQSLTLQYKQHLAASHLILREEMARRRHTHTASFAPGTVAAFSGAHPATTRKVLKALLGSVAPVAYVDFAPPAPGEGDGTGWVRFKSARDAEAAVRYFAGTRVVQAAADDSTGSLQPHDAADAGGRAMLGDRGKHAPPAEGRMTIFGREAPEGPRARLRLRLLKGDEEGGYWERIAEQKKARVRKGAAAPREGLGEVEGREARGRHVRFSDPEEGSDGEAEEGARHVVFADSEGEDEGSDTDMEEGGGRKHEREGSSEGGNSPKRLRA
ncbi:hypothetical protein DFJ74DRAFT_769721 [Hyaloraphidium curvatum]|nr:hypothetical protein DFJ74DRAFT_769721 [Hyaloraphidium curvatum]